MNFLRVFLCAIYISAFRLNRETLHNDFDARQADSREDAVANAWTPEEGPAHEDGGWFKVSPYGVFPGKTPGRPQYFGEPQAREVVSEFNSVLGRLGRLFRGVPIYRGHPDVDPVVWPDDRRVGKIIGMEARGDGLWARAEWNSLGAENQREGYWIYPSPRWDAPAGRPRFEPDRLISVGLTNTPRIPESEPVANATAADDHSPETETATNTEDIPMDPKLIRDKLGLAPETTDDEVFAKIDALLQAATLTDQAEAEKQTAEVECANATRAKDSMACSLAAARSEANGAIISLAIREGRITAADKPQWETKLAAESTREAAVNAIGTLRPVLNTTPITGGADRADRAQSDTLREQVANAVADLQDKQGLSYHEAWLKVKKDDRFAAYFGRES